jgi:hypothetical protein
MSKSKPINEAEAGGKIASAWRWRQFVPGFFHPEAEGGTFLHNVGQVSFSRHHTPPSGPLGHTGEKLALKTRILWHLHPLLGNSSC